MPVRDLAPSLFALGTLFTEASLAAYPDRDPASLSIKASRDGSFAVELALHSPAAWDQVKQLLTGSTVEALTNLQAIVFGPLGLLWLIKLLRGERIESMEPLANGHIRVRLPDGTVLEALPETLATWEQLHARENARDVVEPLRRPGIDTVEFVDNGVSVLAIEKDDLLAYDASEPEEEPLDDREENTVVTLATAALIGAYKWRFSEGDNIFTASMDDPAFRARIDAGEAFRKGDMMRVRMRTVQTRRGEKLHVERMVREVLNHYPRMVQTSLEGELSADE
jgi:hypothetical protein